MAKKKKQAKTFSGDHVAVMIEEMHGQFKAFGDGQKNLERKVDDLVDRFNKFDIRLSNVEDKVSMEGIRSAVIDGNIREIKRDIKDGYKSTKDYFSRIEKEIMPIKAEIKDLKSRLKEKAELAKLFVLEKRIEVIEKKLARA